MKPHKMTMFLETLIEIAMHVGHSKMCMDDSRNLVSTILKWANEFEKIHRKTEWDIDRDFIEEVDQFTQFKIDDAIANEKYGARVISEGATKHNFLLGNIAIGAGNINELKEFVQEIADKLAPGEEHSKYISDFIYSVESEYQRFHELDADNWDIVH